MCVCIIWNTQHIYRLDFMMVLKIKETKLYRIHLRIRNRQWAMKTSPMLLILKMNWMIPSMKCVYAQTGVVTQYHSHIKWMNGSSGRLVFRRTAFYFMLIFFFITFFNWIWEFSGFNSRCLKLNTVYTVCKFFFSLQ